jgi:hypothetical protein
VRWAWNYDIEFIPQTTDKRGVWKNDKRTGDRENDHQQSWSEYYGGIGVGKSG